MTDQAIISAGDVEIYESDIDRAITEACDRYGIDDLVKEGQTRWKAVLHFVGKTIFPNNQVLRDKQVIHLNGNPVPTNNNRFDTDILNILCDYYIQLSRRYNKLISSLAFSEFINIPTNTIDTWRTLEPSSARFQIWKKLQTDREDGLKDKAIDSGNVMGIFQVGRREYQWDMPGVRDESNRTRALTAAELPKLGPVVSDQGPEDVQ